MTPEQKQFLVAAAGEAKRAGHIFPEMAACEAALESAYGTSELARQDRNLFGTKQHRHVIYGTHVLPTREFENGEWITINSSWVSYPDFASCFRDRMVTLVRLASVLPHYGNALRAQDAKTYVTEVSKTWATDPERAEKVIAIYEAAGSWEPAATIAT
jgi:flagellum-specific peptidoglycan hydrolase FlgJ